MVGIGTPVRARRAHTPRNTARILYHAGQGQSGHRRIRDVIGNDLAIAVGGQAGNFELIVMLPVMAYNLLQSIELLASASENFAARCIEGMAANVERCRDSIEQSLAMCTALAPVIGYDAAAQIAKEAYVSGKTVREVARSRQVLPEARLSSLLDPWRMTGRGK